MSQLTTGGQSNVTASNQSIEGANGVTFVYRRFGKADGATLPLVGFQHYRGDLDNWDPALVDAIAERREIILFDNAGVGGSSGAVPRTITAMAHDALAFLDALGLKRIDILGYSTADEPGGEDLQALFFERSETSAAKGWEFIERIFARTDERDPGTTLETRDAQLDAICAWGVPDGQHAPPRRPAARRAAEDLPGRRPRLPLPVPGGVRRRGQRLPGLTRQPAPTMETEHGRRSTR
jgi:pimeloyl-ACP methyl ester carboxylesterase